MFGSTNNAESVENRDSFSPQHEQRMLGDRVTILMDDKDQSPQLPNQVNKQRDDDQDLAKVHSNKQIILNFVRVFESELGEKALITEFE